LSKVLPLAEALRRHVPGRARRSCSARRWSASSPSRPHHELIRQRRRDLTLVGPISDICFEQLIAAGCVRAVVAAWVGNVQHGAAYVFRRALEQGVPRPLTIEDHSNFSIALALEAAAQGVPYLPTRSLLGSDILAANPRPPRGAVSLHGRAAGPRAGAHAPTSRSCTSSARTRPGTAMRGGPTGVSAAAGKASRAVIVVAEELVEPAVIHSDPNRTFLPGFLRDAVVHLPGGAHPSPVQGHYNRDHASTPTWQRALGHRGGRGGLAR
jgi:glutaconate CoA-transferase subunit A